MKFDNKSVVVTGGSKGIGRAIAKAFIAEGASVCVFDIEKPSFDVKFYEVDVRSEEQIKASFSTMSSLDILVNNAGIYFQKGIEDVGLDELRNIFSINYNGTFLCAKYGLPLLKKSKGNIVNIASALGIAPEASSPAYCSTKAAVIMLTKCLSLAYANDGIRVNAVLPGVVDTDLLRNSVPDEKERELYAQQRPLKRFGLPIDVANTVLFLASEQASFITGAQYTVDGGESIASFYSSTT